MVDGIEILVAQLFHFLSVKSGQKRLPHQFDAQRREVAGANFMAFMVVVQIVLKHRAPGNQVLAFWAKGVLEPLIQVVNIGLGVKAGQRPKFRAAIGVVQEVIQLAAIALENHFRS